MRGLPLMSMGARKALYAVLLSTCLWLAACGVPQEAVAGKMPGGAECVSCHPAVARQLGEAVVHAPFAQKDCSACHNPHTARNPSLLRERTAELCRRCHGGEEGQKGAPVMAGATSRHAPFVQGDCLACHAPHASTAKGLLKGQGMEVCTGCHPDQSAEAGISHKPVVEGRCLSCHAPHESARPTLLRESPADLCRSCHGSGPVGAHTGFRVEKTRCVTCHSPHGSGNKGQMRRNPHAPFGKGECSACHTVDVPRLKEESASLCLSCHPVVEEEFCKIKSHVGGGLYCVSCHAPHGTDAVKMVQSKEQEVCLGCHVDTRTRLDDPENTHAHPHVKKGDCSACHEPHGANGESMLKDDAVGSCTACHDRHASFTHPVGDEVRDPRTGRPVTCVTCHSPMGAGFEYALRMDRRKDLCVQCHRGY